jgi:hypothetical protein
MRHVASLDAAEARMEGCAPTRRRAAEERGREVEGRATLKGVQLPQGAPPEWVLKRLGFVSFVFKRPGSRPSTA